MQSQLGNSISQKETRSQKLAKEKNLMFSQFVGKREGRTSLLFTVSYECWNWEHGLSTDWNPEGGQIVNNMHLQEFNLQGKKDGEKYGITASRNLLNTPFERQEWLVVLHLTAI